MSIASGKGWGSLAYWRSGEWQLIRERLQDEAEYNPPHHLLFAALRAVHPAAVRVAILGQDPYPIREHCTGVAFSTGECYTGKLPPTLINIFKEYQADLGYPAPKNGDLTKWCNQGVLLWNVYPTCATGRPGSHHWEEWTYLTREIVEKLDERQVVFVTLGSVARAYVKYISRSPCIQTSHPSPRGANHGFFGSRIFSSVNFLLGTTPINWYLGEGDAKPQHLDNKSAKGAELSVQGECYT